MASIYTTVDGRKSKLYYKPGTSQEKELKAKYGGQTTRPADWATQNMPQVVPPPNTQVVPSPQTMPIGTAPKINPEVMEQDNSLVIPQRMETQDPVSLVNSLFKMDSATMQPLKETETLYDKRLREQYDQYATKPERMQQLQKKLGVTNMTKSVQDLNSQLEQLRGQFDQRIAGLEGQGRGISKSIILGQQGALEKQKAVKVGALASVLQAAQGNLSLAQQTIRDTLDLEFGAIEAQINQTKDLLDRNRDKMNDVQKERADKLNIILDERKRILDDQRKDREERIKLAADYTTIGGDSLVANQILEAKTYEDAYRLAAPTISKYYQEEIGLERSNRRSLISSRNGGGGSSGSFTSNQLEKGAAIAQTSINSFRTLPADVQNFYINNQTDAKDMREAIRTANAGTDPDLTTEDIRSAINDGSLPPELKSHFLSMLKEPVATESSGGGWWGKVKGWFGF